MSNGVNQFERLFKLWATVAKLVLDGKRSAQKVADALQSIVNEAHGFSMLYFHSKQMGKVEGDWISGTDLNRHLLRQGLYSRTLSLEDERVQEWIANPSAYPEEYRGKVVCLWKSQKDGHVTVLMWFNGQLYVDSLWIGGKWNYLSPVLLTND